jgi:hypothetical protein
MNLVCSYNGYSAPVQQAMYGCDVNVAFVFCLCRCVYLSAFLRRRWLLVVFSTASAVLYHIHQYACPAACVCETRCQRCRHRKTILDVFDCR